MRFAELTFLVLMVAYHAVLLVPRRRRPFPANYLVFLAGMALAWNLGLEGLRWQTVPMAVLILVDLAILFPTFATLRGRPRRTGFLAGLGSVLRTLLASVGLLTAVSGAILAVTFPLPKVELTGGLTPALREVRFPADAGHPGLELHVWYPAEGDRHPLPRPRSREASWAAVRDSGGLPVFWQAYQRYLPTPLVVGGKLASPATKYPVVWVALPAGESPEDFGYCFEDLASRGFVVVAPTPVLPPVGPDPEFTWAGAWKDLQRPFLEPELWFQPESTFAGALGATDYRWLLPARTALRQLAEEPGDPFFDGVDWGHQGLWVWGRGNLPSGADREGLALRGLFHAGGPAEGHGGLGQELWVLGTKAPSSGAGQYTLALPSLSRADLADSAYLKPYLAFRGLKSQADAGFHGVLRQYQAAFFTNAFWGSSDGSFAQTVPEVPGLVLSGH